MPLTRQELESGFDFIRTDWNWIDMVRNLWIVLNETPELEQALENNDLVILAVILERLYARAHLPGRPCTHNTIRNSCGAFHCAFLVHSEGRHYQYSVIDGRITNPPRMAAGQTFRLMTETHRQFAHILPMEHLNFLKDRVERDHTQWARLMQQPARRDSSLLRRVNNTPLNVIKDQIRAFFFADKNFCSNRTDFPSMRMDPVATLNKIEEYVRMGSVANYLKGDAKRDAPTRQRNAHLRRVGVYDEKPTTYFAQLNGTIEGATDEGGWIEGQKVVITFKASGREVGAVIMKVGPIASGIRVKLDASKSVHLIRAEHLHGQVDATIRLKEPEDDVVHSILLRQPLNSLNPFSMATKIVNAVYLGLRTDLSAPTSAGAPASIHRKGEQLNMDPQQQLVIGSCLTDTPILFCEAAFGSGKTLTMSAAAVTIAKKNRLVIVLAKNNSAVQNFAETLSELNENDIPTLHTLAPTAREEFSSEKSVARQIELLTQNIELMNRLSIVDPVVHASLTEHVEASRRSLYVNKENVYKATIDEQNQYLLDKVRLDDSKGETLSHVLGVLKPGIVLSTIDHFLNVQRGPSSFSGYIRSEDCPVTVILDESSQIGEGTFIAILRSIPNARIRCIGDPKQLPPFTHLKTVFINGRAAATPITHFLTASEGVLKVSLTGVYRCHPRLTDMASDLFYAPVKLNPKKLHGQRADFFPKVAFPRADIPLAVCDIPGREHLIGTSYDNEEETIAACEIVRHLLVKLIPATSIMIITFYNAHRDAVKLELKNFAPGVRCKTVDACQGMEAEAVILLCTRTNPKSDSYFIDEPHRLNVSLTRAKQALFILGAKPVFRENHNLSHLMHWLNANEVPFLDGVSSLLL